MINSEELREKIERKLINYVCSACDNTEDLRRLKTADEQELLLLAKKHNINAEECQDS
ncbi:MAG: hypothetical protein IJE10_01110 [Clostridia bacterium]|nr:hypothetical protein [Clostridia bacterium]